MSDAELLETMVRRAAKAEGWKESAMVVLAEWDRVFEALGRPGTLGGSEAAAALTEVERLIKQHRARAERIHRLRSRVESLEEAIAVHRDAEDFKRFTGYTPGRVSIADHELYAALKPTNVRLTDG